jgi:hypothetical protein
VLCIYLHISVTAPIAPAFKNYYTEQTAPAGINILSRFCTGIQVAVLLLKPPQGGFRSETAQIYNGYM